MLLVYLSLAFVLGIVFGSKISLPLWSLCLALIPLPLTWLFHQYRKYVLTGSLCLLALLGGMVRYQSSLPAVNAGVLQFYNNSGAAQIKGVIASAPDVRDTNIQIQLSASQINIDGNQQKISGKALLFISRQNNFSYGDELTVTGRLESPQKIEGFDYPGYLANQGIYSIISYPKVEVTATGKGFKPLGWVYSLRNLLAQKMSEALPEPQASLAQGIILGIRGNIPESLNSDFARTGTTHILAISGANLSIVAGILVAAGIWLFGKRRYLYVWLALAAIWVYSLLTGFNAPVVRSALMLTLFLLADVLGRQRSAITALAFAAGIMIATNPRTLWDASFQLSFLAMLGLVYIVPPLQALGSKLITERFGEGKWLSKTSKMVMDSFAVSLGVTLIVWPIIAYYFGIFSIVSPLATLLIVPVLPAIMVIGAAAAGLGVIFLPLGQFVGWIAWLFLSYMLWVVNGFARMPISSIATGRIDPAILWIYYVALAIAVWIYFNRSNVAKALTRGLDSLAGLSPKWVMPPLLTLTILAVVFTSTMPDNKLHVSFLDVGQGDSILIQTPNHQDILIDGGPSPQSLELALGKKLPFWDRTIELVVVTHPHADHLTGLVDVLKKYGVKEVIYPDTTTTSSLWQEFESLVQKKDIKATIAQTGQVIKLSQEAEMEVLHAQGVEKDTTLDTQGIVVRLKDDTVSFLFTADVGQETEIEMLIERQPLKNTVLKVGHHGSETSTSAEFLSVVEPAVAVISVGTNNDYGHPNKEVMARLGERVENIYRTDKNGTVELITDGTKLWVKNDK